MKFNAAKCHLLKITRKKTYMDTSCAIGTDRRESGPSSIPWSGTHLRLDLEATHWQHHLKKPTKFLISSAATYIKLQPRSQAESIHHICPSAAWVFLFSTGPPLQTWHLSFREGSASRSSVCHRDLLLQRKSNLHAPWSGMDSTTTTEKN